jgi:hypothetical protein
MFANEINKSQINAYAQHGQETEFNTPLDEQQIIRRFCIILLSTTDGQNKPNIIKCVLGSRENIT